jgi:predicted ArsR family transcriptional regulator
MQETRRSILEILRERGEATVDDIIHDLEKIRGSITAVTVRHHLNKLQDDGLISIPQMRHRSSPGRPQHIYTLSEQGLSQFPNNYQTLSTILLEQLSKRLSQKEVNVIIEGVADNMARNVDMPDGSIRRRLDTVVNYLNEHGYDASWDVASSGYILTTVNCPYHQVVNKAEHLCQMDVRLVSQMLGVVPRLRKNIAQGDQSCEYFIPEKL